MKYITSMDVLESTEKLVKEKLVMLCCEVIIRSDDLMEIRLHELENNIYILELPPRRGEHYVLDLYYVRMAEQPKELDLTEDARGIRYVLKHIIDLLNRNPLTGAGIYCSSNYSITPLANDFLDLVLACLSILSEEFFLQCILLVGLDGERHLALGDADGAEADKIQALDDGLDVGELLAGGGLVGGAGHGAGGRAAVEQAAEPVDDAGPSHHVSPSPTTAALAS